jgi:hypothetical protein
MKTYRVSLTFMTACALLLVSPFLTVRGAARAPVAANDLSKAARGVLVRAHNARTSAAGSQDLSLLTRRELARARRATAKYHDIANALADGYVDGNFHASGEGHHYINNLLVDGHFDPEQPEVLLYAARPGEDGLRLVALEYISPDTFPVPEGFTGDDDVWQMEEPLPIWVLNAWIWLHNPNGTFTFLNPRVP